MRRLRLRVRTLMLLVAAMALAIEAGRLTWRVIDYRTRAMKFAEYRIANEKAFEAISREARRDHDRAEQFRRTEPGLAAHYDEGGQIQRRQIAEARVSIGYYEMLSRKYRDAMWHPWRSAPIDPPRPPAE